MPPQALILFAHGARDPEWSQTFERLREAVATKCPNTKVIIAYLEFMQPNLPDAISKLTAEGATTIDIVPAFMAQGGHLKRDLPILVDAARTRHPGAMKAGTISIVVAPSAVSLLIASGRLGCMNSR